MGVLQTETESNAPLRPYRVLIAVAFDATADCALREGMNLAAARPGAELHVVHVVSEASTLAAADSFRSTERDLTLAPELLRARIERIWQETHEIQVIGHIRPGQAADVILQVAIDIEADVLVLGTHHLSGLQKVLLGSVAARVLHSAHCPVLVAVPKNYVSDAASEHIEPACPDCLALRAQSSNAQFWCERHTRPSLQPHIYVPRAAAGDAVFTTY